LNQGESSPPGFFISLIVHFRNFNYIAQVIIRFLIIFSSLFIFQACSNIGQDNQKNLAELDKLYGKCDNPMRTLRPIEYKICKDKEKAAGPDGVVDDPINLTEIFDNINNPRAVYAASDTNTYLWDASLKTLSPYSIKISDFDGGYIETNWILKNEFPNERCLIKTHVVSPELISTGVNVNVICEKLINDGWYLINQEYKDQEKQLTLKILSEASTLYQSSS